MTRDRAGQAERAPAKINLALHVTGQRPDGYHLIESLAVFTRFGDTITVEHSDADSFSVSGPYSGHVPTGNDNLVMKALLAYRARFPAAAGQPLAIALEKNIPPVSGVGGGSSDAAATLRALARFFGIDDVVEGMSGLAPALGADVPMCLAGRPLIARGIGEVLEPVADFPVLHIVLANAGIAVPTPQVFAGLEDKHNGGMPHLPAGVDAVGLADWLGTTRNDLFKPALKLAPAIGDTLDALHAQGAAFARMSGSGATCFGLFADAAAAGQAASAIARAEPRWFVVATQTTS